MQLEALTWTKTGWFRREWVLARGGEQLARLAFGGWGSGATVETAGGIWTLRRSGIWKPRISMRQAATELAARAHWSGKYDLETPLDGAHRWRSLNMWGSQYGWTSFDGTLLVRYRPSKKFCSGAYLVEFPDAQPLTDSRLLLTVLGGYLLVLTQEEAAAAAVVAVS